MDVGRRPGELLAVRRPRRPRRLPGDDLSIGLDPSRASTVAVRERLVALHPQTSPTPAVAAEFAEHMKFSDCLPAALALEVARQRLIDPAGVRRVLEELGFGHADDANQGPR